MNDRDLRAQEPCAQIKKRIEEARKEKAPVKGGKEPETLEQRIMIQTMRA